MSTKSLLHNLIYDKGGISILWEAMDYSINGIGTTGWPSGPKKANKIISYIQQQKTSRWIKDLKYRSTK